jgi:uncharacterized RDD family membrane protein YckC
MSEIRIVPGNGSKDRLFASCFDNLFIIVIGLVAAASVPSTEVALRVTVLVAAYLGYFFLFEAIIGTSPGKLVFGLWVRRIEGGPCSWQQAAIRTLARVFEVNPLLLGALPAGIAILNHRAQFSCIDEICTG